MPFAAACPICADVSGDFSWFIQLLASSSCQGITHVCSGIAQCQGIVELEHHCGRQLWNLQ